ncbi:GNAT family N-acetyltransferase [Nucisporomicrobium flavum]|uniref:GNAT family N-acetyltransferase n=1 Tax=Nucisporomicrobium flavum TaxID=2785915 RepID=UPI0018F415FC|nr:GNAT family N-acetyltransferase [Nucisporomicrobium flavum]
MSVLDNPVWAALSGPHAGHADRYGRSARYDPEVSPFAAVDDPTDESAWDDLRTLIGPGNRALLAGPGLTPPPGWVSDGGVPGVQLVGTDDAGAVDPSAEPLGETDLPEILDLVARTRPGPFRKRTIELGVYAGIRRDGVLVAMAGERMRVPGYTEISAVCTDPAYRGAGLAGRLVAHVAAGIRGRGEVPFLHAAADNVGAVRLYRRLGFSPRTEVRFMSATAA